MRIHLVRHGLTKSNEEKRYTGFKDVSLSEKGIDLLHKLKEVTEFPKPDFVISSPMQRCIETLKILFDLEANSFVEDLKETNFGDWEGKTYLDLKNDPDYIKWISDFEVNCPPNGESFSYFQDRVINAFEKIIEEVKEYNDVLIVTHGGVLRVLMEHYGDKSIEFFNWNIPNGLGYTLDLADKTYKEIGNHFE